MTAPTPIPPDRLQAALRALVESQVKPMNAHQHKLLGWRVLDALSPELAMLPPLEAFQRVSEPANQETI